MKSWPPSSIVTPSPCATPTDGSASLARGREFWRLPVVGLVRSWFARCRERRELEALTPRELRDFNVSRYDVLIEARKPFWRM
ncbi:DUF1127 domain-containing protein [Muricoccus radiodurans]|uniref:DUF1127 domain-containing protein n=1 Tax=Muricoccus radiodurans TaxID=2231721 RepID=UPI003CEE5AAC